MCELDGIAGISLGAEGRNDLVVTRPDVGLIVVGMIVVVVYRGISEGEQEGFSVISHSHGAII